MTRLRRLAAATTLLAAVAGCSTAVNGKGTFAGGSGGATASGSQTPTPSPTSSGGAGRSQLSCSGGTVLQPRNSPYCYVLPGGFKDVSALTSTTVGQSGEHPTSVALSSENITQAVRDLIIVLDFTLRLDTDQLSDEQLVQQLGTLVAQFEAQGFTFDNKVPGRVAVDGARGFTYRARSREGYSSDLVFAFRGKQEIELNCQYKAHAAEIQRACASILSSLQFLNGS